MSRTRQDAAQQWPRCHQHGLLRSVRRPREDWIISTAALYELLGNNKYQKAVAYFRYRYGGGPEPGPIEDWLRKQGY